MFPSCEYLLHTHLDEFMLLMILGPENTESLSLYDVITPKLCYVMLCDAVTTQMCYRSPEINRV